MQKRRNREIKKQCMRAPKQQMTLDPCFFPSYRVNVEDTRCAVESDGSNIRERLVHCQRPHGPRWPHVSSTYAHLSQVHGQHISPPIANHDSVAISPQGLIINIRFSEKIEDIKRNKIRSKSKQTSTHYTDRAHRSVHIESKPQVIDIVLR
jgi:hypothetical protein